MIVWVLVVVARPSTMPGLGRFFGPKWAFALIEAKGRSKPIALKIPFFALIDEVFRCTGPRALWRRGVQPNWPSPCMCQLSSPHERSHLTSKYDGLFSENHAARISRFFNQSAQIVDCCIMQRWLLEAVPGPTSRCKLGSWSFVSRR